MTTSYVLEAQAELKKMKKLRNEAEAALKNSSLESEKKAEPVAKVEAKPKAKAKKQSKKVELTTEEKGESDAS